MPRPTPPRLLLALALLAVPLADRPAAAQAPAPSVATQTARGRAQAAFAAARADYDAGRHAQALEGFRASYALVASPISHLYAARALVALGRHADAYAELDAVFHEANDAAVVDAKYDETRAAAEAELAEARRRVVLVSVTVADAPADATLDVAGREVPLGALSRPIPATPGTVVATLRAPGRPDVNAWGNGVAGATLELRLAGRAAAQPTATATLAATQRPASATRAAHGTDVPTAAWIAGGIGAAGLSTFAVAGALARYRYDDLKRSCGGACPPERQSDVDAGRRDQTIANVGLVVGLVGVATSAAIFAFAPSQPTSPRASAAPHLDVGLGWVAVGGGFR